MNRILAFPVAFGAAVLAVANLQAATLSSAGIMADLTPPGHATGTDVADLDAAGVANDGFVLFNSQPEGTNVSGQPWDQAMVDVRPAYITAIDGSAAQSSGGWANYDDVSTGATLYNTGGIVLSPGDGVETQLFNLTLGGAVPAVISLGVITDNSDAAVWASTNVRIGGPGGLTADQDTVPNGGTDLVQFDIVNGAPGEVYTIYATSPPSGALLGGITFDSIPEPGVPAILAACLVPAILLRRRRRPGRKADPAPRGYRAPVCPPSPSRRRAKSTSIATNRPDHGSTRNRATPGKPSA